MDNPLADSSSQQRRAEPCSLVIFGATGDLTARKLAPALWNLHRLGHLPRGFTVLGFGRSELDDDAFRERMRKAIGDQADNGNWNAFADRLFYFRGGYDDADSFAALGRRLGELREKESAGGNHLFYLATPASTFGPIVRTLGEAGVVPGEGH